MQTIIEKLLFEVRASVPSSLHLSVLASDDSGCTLQVGRSQNAVVTITLQDAVQFSFAITYPALSVGRDGHEAVEERTSTDVGTRGVSWIVRKVFRFGFVPPDSYRRLPRNLGVPQHP